MKSHLDDYYSTRIDMGVTLPFRAEAGQCATCRHWAGAHGNLHRKWGYAECNCYPSVKVLLEQPSLNPPYFEPAQLVTREDFGCVSWTALGLEPGECCPQCAELDCECGD